MDKPKRIYANGVLLFAVLVGAPVQGAPFDERLKAPRATSVEMLETRIKAHFKTFQSKQLDGDPAAFIRDTKAHKQWSDLYFAVKLALDDGKRLDGLSEFGLIAKPDGTYTVDLNNFPQWEPLDSRLDIFTNAEVLESYVPALKARGFRDADVELLRDYVATHDPRSVVHREGSQLVDTFAKRIRGKRVGGQTDLNLDEVMAYRYQKAAIRAEAKRQWALGLLASLDNQRQRILASFVEEFNSEMTFGLPSGPLDQVLAKEAEPLLSGAYVQLLAYEEQQIRKAKERRAEQLKRGEQQ